MLNVDSRKKMLTIWCLDFGFFVSKVSAIHFHYIQKKADLSQTGQLLHQNNLQLMIESHYGTNEKLRPN